MANACSFLYVRHCDRVKKQWRGRVRLERDEGDSDDRVANCIIGRGDRRPVRRYDHIKWPANKTVLDQEEQRHDTRQPRPLSPRQPSTRCRAPPSVTWVIPRELVVLSQIDSFDPFIFPWITRGHLIICKGQRPLLRNRHCATAVYIQQVGFIHDCPTCCLLSDECVPDTTWLFVKFGSRAGFTSSVLSEEFCGSTHSPGYIPSGAITCPYRWVIITGHMTCATGR
ncbi:hypothetical protein CBL_02726 [Carabus blaptoides fortunei]